jgi:hypothetical protein
MIPFATPGASQLNFDKRMVLAAILCGKCDEAIARKQEIVPIDYSVMDFLFPEARYEKDPKQISVRINAKYVLNQLKKKFSLVREDSLTTLLQEKWSQDGLLRS